MTKSPENKALFSFLPNVLRATPPGLEQGRIGRATREALCEPHRCGSPPGAAAPTGGPLTRRAVAGIAGPDTSPRRQGTSGGRHARLVLPHRLAPAAVPAARPGGSRLRAGLAGHPGRATPRNGRPGHTFGRRPASASGDGSVRVWDLTAGWKERALNRPTCGVQSKQFRFISYRFVSFRRLGVKPCGTGWNDTHRPGHPRYSGHLAT
jgi:hypothetical protein